MQITTTSDSSPDRPHTGGSRQWHRTAAAALAVTLATVVAGCGGSGGGGARATDRITTSPPVPCGTGFSGGAPACPAPPTPRHGPVTTTTLSTGYRYLFSATPVTRQVSITDFLGGTDSAPPGKAFLASTVTITNPLTDRSEPDLAVTDNGLGPFELDAPTADGTALGGCAAPPAPRCLLSLTAIGQENPEPDNPLSPQIAPGASTQVVVYVGPVPTSVAPEPVTVYFIEPNDSTAVPIRIATS